MAPHLAASQHAIIHDMLIDGTLMDVQIAAVAGCSDRAIRRIRSNILHFDSTKSPPNGGGRPRRMTHLMLDAVCERLIEKPSMYLEEMSIFLFDEFYVLVTPSTISRALARVGWSKKAARQIARERNADLRDFYLYKLFQGSTDSSVFEDFIQRLLQHCRPWPEPKSVLIMDNASFHHSDRIKQMCSDARVKLIYLPPYSPDFNPIEEFFAELKAFIKKRWQEYEDNPKQDFGVWLEWCINVVGSRESHAEGHFRHSGLSVEKP